MAFNKAPSQSTYQTKDVKLIWALSNREGSFSKDPTLLNGFYEIVKDKATKDEDYYVVKRDGSSLYGWEAPSANIRGIFYWEDQDKLYVAYDSSLAIVTVSTASLLTTLTPFSTSTGEVAFSEFYFEDGTSKVVFGDGVGLWTVDSSNTLVANTDADLPSPYIPNLVFLDGYLFLIKSGTADIYNSALNDPLSWTPGDFISTEMLPDTLLKISRLNNYMVAFGSGSVEYFFDAANSSGSPLQRNDTPVKQIGYLGGFAAYGNKVLFIGQYASAAPELFILEDFKMDEISLPPIRRFLQKNTAFYASLVSNGGKDFYVLTMGTDTFVFDLDTRLWTQWAFKSTTSFDIRYAFSVKLSGKHNSLFSVNGGTKFYYFSPTVYTDASEAFTFSGITQRLLWDTAHKKFMSRLIITADKNIGTLSISWSDDDYQTYTTPRDVSLNVNRPILHQLGSFFSRVFKFSHVSNAPCRLMNFEVDFNIGNR